jgi:hypothetical protein
MGWNFRRSTKIAPGVRLNFSKKGMGVSLGPRGSKISFSPGGRITSNIGIPGTSTHGRGCSNPDSILCVCEDFEREKSFIRLELQHESPCRCFYKERQAMAG